MAFRQQFKSHVRFILMNSFSTSADTLSYLSKYPTLVADPNLELLQNKASRPTRGVCLFVCLPVCLSKAGPVHCALCVGIRGRNKPFPQPPPSSPPPSTLTPQNLPRQHQVPKVDAKTLAPAEWPTNRNQEWCPPGHGDLYAALAGSGTLDRLLADGVKYMFVSNSDNLGATLDLALLTHFAESGSSFMMECAERTEADKKGGHLAVRAADGQLILRESAQCAKEDEGAFQDVTRHKYFNTNNLWVRLDKLKEAIAKEGGLIPLPMIKNGKTVDPKDGSSPAVRARACLPACVRWLGWVGLG
jgi:UDP-N-acetylglucosamine pyrophosphorylase